MMGNAPEVLIYNQLFLKLNGSFVMGNFSKVLNFNRFFSKSIILLKLIWLQCMISGSFSWVCICILNRGHFRSWMYTREQLGSL